MSAKKFELFKRVGSIIIDGKEFKFPPLDFEFELSQTINSFTKIHALLYNPNDTTISKCRHKTVNGKTVYPDIELIAGYGKNFGTCGLGAIKAWDVYRRGTDRILDLQIFDSKGWIDEFITQSKTTVKRKASEILNEIIGDRPSQISLGEDVLIPRLAVMTVYEAIRNISARTKSRFALRNGIAIIEPDKSVVRQPVKLDYSSGLISTPEKIDRPAEKKGRSGWSGYRIKTLFLYGLNIWRFVKVKTKKVTFEGRIEKVTQRFSTFAQAESEYEVNLL